MRDQTDQYDRELALELTESVLTRLAPEEVLILPDISQEFFDDPERSVARAREETLGFGADVALLAPFALSVAIEVVKFLLSLAKDALGPEVKSGLAAWVRRVVPGRGTRPAQADPAPALTREQLVLVRQVAYSRAHDLGLDDDRAATLADAVVGGVLLTDDSPSSP